MIYFISPYGAKLSFDTLHGLCSVFYSCAFRAEDSEACRTAPDCRQEAFRAVPSGTAGFLSDGENGRAAWEVKERKDHHAQRGFIVQPDESSSPPRPLSAPARASRRRKRSSPIPAAAVRSPESSGQTPEESRRPFRATRPPAQVPVQQTSESFLPRSARFPSSHRSSPAGAATAAALPRTNRLRSITDRTSTVRHLASETAAALA